MAICFDGPGGFLEYVCELSSTEMKGTLTHVHVGACFTCDKIISRKWSRRKSHTIN